MIVREATAPAWHQIVADSPYASPFHAFEWGKIIAQTLGGTYRPLIIESQVNSWLAPVFCGGPWSENSHQLRLGSLGYGGPLPQHKLTDPGVGLHESEQVVAAIKNYTKAETVHAILYPDPLWSAIQTKGQTAKVYLKESAEQVFDTILSGNVRSTIKKSIAAQVQVRPLEIANQEELAAAYELVAQTQRQVGADYITPFTLFKELCSLHMQDAAGQAFVACYEERIIAVMVLVYNQRESFFLLHGWDRNFARLAANQALIWEMIRYSVERRITVFNMGASHSEALLQSKLRWGAVVENIPQLDLN